MNYIKVFLKQFSKAIFITAIKSTVVIVGVVVAIYFIVMATIMLSGKYPLGKYPPGKDTVESFGSGRYQIVAFPSFGEKQKEYSLRDEKKNVSVVRNIYKYNNKDEWGKVYIIGKNSYTILDYKKEKYKQTDNITDFNSDEQGIFNEMNSIEWKKLP